MDWEEYKGQLIVIGVGLVALAGWLACGGWRFVAGWLGG